MASQFIGYNQVVGNDTITSSNNSYDVLLARYIGCPSSGIENLSETSDISIFPNPTSGLLNVLSNRPNEKLKKLAIYNTLGEKIREQCLFGSNTEFDLSSMPSGLYYLLVMGEHKISRYPISVER